MSDPAGPAQMDIRPARKGWLAQLSVVWLVPLFALAVSLGVAWQSYANRGTLIQIEFENASGISAGETVIKYRDVDVGTVEDINFADGLDVVIVSARIKSDIAPYLDDDAQFWVVTPDVSVRGISGLETVLSGVFIQGTWDTEADVAQTSFVGLEEPPLTTADQRGTAVVLRARDGSALADGAPILHKGIQVGFLETPRLAPNGQNVTVNAFIEAPFDRIITSNTRFWDTSGFSISLGAGGVSLDVDSLASLIEGGVAFDTVVSGGRPIQDGQSFTLFESEDAARVSLFDDGPAAELLNVMVLFDGSVNGLAIGSDVRFQGITVGEVIDLAAVVVEDEDQARVQLRTVLGIDPNRIGMQGDATPDQALSFLSDYVDQGLRARLATGNILSGSLVVQLTEVTDAPIAALNLNGEPYPILPSAPSAITDVADTADDVLQRINDLPIEDLMNSAISLMNSIETLANDQQLREVPDSVIALLEDARGVISSDALQAIPTDAQNLLLEMQNVLTRFAETGTVENIGRAAGNAASAAATLDQTAAALPEITAQAQDLLSRINALQIEAAVASVQSSLDQLNGFLSSDEVVNLPSDLAATMQDAQAAAGNLNALLASDETQAIPADIRRSLAQFEQLLSEATQGDLIGTLNQAAQSAANTAQSLEESTQALPGILSGAETFVANANDLELQAVIGTAQETLSALQTLLADDGTQSLPQSVSDAADELQLFLSEVRDGGAVANVNAALASANSAAQAIEDAAESLPSLTARATALAQQTQTLLETYDDRSRFNTETLSTLRDIQEAADAVSALARAIQRNPNSLLTGR